MTGPYPPPQQPGQNDGSWQQQPWQQPGPPPQDPTSPASYDLYPQQGGWPDQAAPTTGGPAPQPGYGPPPVPPVYGPTSGPPAYGPPGAPQYPQPGAPQYGQPGQFMPPAPPPSSGSNKGWIFGGLAVAVVVALVVVGIVVTSNLNSDTGSGTGSSGDGPDGATQAKYQAISDLCETFSESDYGSVLGPQGSAEPDKSEYSYGVNLRCKQELEGNDYDLGTLNTEAIIYTDVSSVDSDFESRATAYSSTGTIKDLSGFGEKAKIIFDKAIIPSAEIVVMDDNLVIDVRISTTEDSISDSKLQDAAENVVKKIMAGLTV